MRETQEEVNDFLEKSTLKASLLEAYKAFSSVDEDFEPNTMINFRSI